MATILIDMGHPADAHTFRPAAKRWQALGHTVHVAAIDREMLLELLQQHHLPYSVTYTRRNTPKEIIREIPIRTWRTWQTARRVKANLIVGMTNPLAGLVAALQRIPYIALTDTEPAYNALRTSLPFATTVLTPEVFFHDIGAKQRRFAGYKEHLYLHPDVFQPDNSVLAQLGIGTDEPYFVVRFVAWRATHDAHEHGLDKSAQTRIIERLRQHGKVVLSTEDAPPSGLGDVITEYPAERMHDLLAFATLYVGEGNTMASEAAVLGTPSIRMNTMHMGYCYDLQERGLMFQLTAEDEVIAKIDELLTLPNRDSIFAERSAKLLRESVSVTDVLVEEGLRLLPTTTSRK